MASTSRIVDAWNAVEATTNLTGDIVEVGVYKGGTSMVMAYAAIHVAQRQKASKLSRTLWLLDTFEGLPPPTKDDDERAKTRWRAINNKKSRHNTTQSFLRGEGYIDESGVIRWNYGPLEMVAANMNSTGYPYHLMRFIKGKVEDTLTDTMVLHSLPERISVLRLDTDFYSSTKIELDVLFPRLVPGGVLIVDDYCTWGGARKAVDEWLVINGNMIRDVRKSGSHCFHAIKGPRQPAKSHPQNSALTHAPAAPRPTFGGLVLEKVAW